MGVSTNVYTVFGIRLPYDKAFTEAYDDHYEALEDCVIVDGMGGDYIVVGDILFDSGDSRWEPMQGFAEIELGSVGIRKADIIKKFSELMPDHAHKIDAPWLLMTFVHYH